MKLKDYLTTNDITPAEFAKDIGVSVQSLYRYLKGERIPERDVMPRISKATQDQVTANSFYQ